MNIPALSTTEDSVWAQPMAVIIMRQRSRGTGFPPSGSQEVDGQPDQEEQEPCLNTSSPCGYLYAFHQHLLYTICLSHCSTLGHAI